MNIDISIAVQAIKNVLTFLLMVCCYVVPQTANAQDACPLSIDIESKVVSSHTNWRAQDRPDISDNSHFLSNVLFATGERSNLAILRPTTYERSDSNKTTSLFYHFTELQPITKDAFSSNIWLICEYLHTIKILTKAIKAQSCTVKNAELAFTFSIDCQ